MAAPSAETQRQRRAHLAHARQELLAPVTAMIGYAQLLLEHAQTGCREHVVKVQVFLTDINDRAAINPRRISYLASIARHRRWSRSPHSSIRA